ncbi:MULTISPECIES: hypothetical protein [unclassified Ruegeria]|uniref:hypothetical protein n=1 Tax=unclassified Ruegeria TaxID=2625375 RepID=UPI0014897FA3|nr:MULTISPECIES: hypothetical protein [unclassified Ruegeria]NOD77730.1 hypothetical protein [Ruegeria sp. HKCCD4332]NOD89938.1 hypothetical protein [Ruegeria sp. HKCCD4318]NOE14616.1 hypothetical protein [Ruegeria sp. HKCCD4318-2]NOG11030.1 hypothetical protein [Ruegeria sp. HKCCD4315]
MLRERQSADTAQSKEDVLAFFRKLKKIDNALRFPEGSGQRLLDIELKPAPFQKRHLFDNMAKQAPALYRDFPQPMARKSDGDIVCTPEQLATRLSKCTSSETYPVRLGTSDEKRDLSIAEILQRWRQSGVIMGVTDLPVRDSALSEFFDVDFLQPWNLMSGASENIRELEMLTAVFSTAGKLTDSHSDDMAVCNHCCIGSKLWLAWDTYEGLAAGLDDVERISVTTRARFDAEAFFSLKSACWFVIRPGETLFLPGKFTHRVYTLENYIGVGSFYVGFSNLLHTARRWMTHGSLWDPEPDGPKGQRADDLLTFGMSSLKTVLHSGGANQQDYGIAEIATALDHIDWSDPVVATLLRDRPNFARAADMLRKATAQTS